MTPLHKDDSAGWELHNKDYLELLPELEAESVDLIFTDLPYQLTKSAYDIAPTQEELNRFAKEAIRVLTKEGALFVFCSHLQLEQLKLAFRGEGYTKERFGVWLKTTNNLSPTPYPKSNLEFWFYLSKAKGITENRLLPFYLSKGSQKLKDHETRQSFRKPVSLCRTIISNHSPANGVVLDCFAGSGSAGVAGLLEGRKVLLNEINNRKIAPIRKCLEKFETYANHKKLEGFTTEEDQVSYTQKQLKKETKEEDKTKQNERKKQRFPASKRGKVARLILQHNFQQPIEPYEFITAVRQVVKIPTLEEAKIYKLCWSIIRGIRSHYPDSNLTIPRENRLEKSLRLYEEFSQKGKKKPIEFELNQKPRRVVRKERRGDTEGLDHEEKLERLITKMKVQNKELPERRKTTKRKPVKAKSPHQPSLLPPEVTEDRRGNTKGLTDEEKFDRIITRAKVQTNDLPERRSK